ncbi:MAG: SIMPL domain-containing protein [Clostridia bacterium]|nr:SIMPL domain-containing protein [Clostridia bacterium]
MKTIKVTGKGQIKVRPDTTRITMTVEGMFPEYGEALRRSSEDTQRISDLLSQFGFERSDLKTLSFSVDPQYESYKERGAYKERFTGYRFRHIMKVEFLSDNDRLGRILYALAKCPVKPEFRLSYTVKDPEKSKNELLGRAVADSREKAGVLTRAAGVTLGSIQSIDYSWGQINFEIQPMNRMLMVEECCEVPVAGGGSYDMDIEPDDIEVSDTVTVIWEIN